MKFKKGKTKSITTTDKNKKEATEHKRTGKWQKARRTDERKKKQHSVCCTTGGFVTRTDGADRLQNEVHTLDHCEVTHI